MQGPCVRLLGNSSLVVDEFLQVRWEELDGIGVLWGVFRLAKSGQVAEKDLAEIGEDGGAARGNTRLAAVASINHDPCYHELQYKSTTI
jgi:hypothetical protein